MPSRCRSGLRSLPPVSLRFAVDRLLQHCPLAHPVEIRYAPLPSGDQGHAELMRAGGRLYFRIRIQPGMARSSELDAIVHEWAHLLVWSDGSDDEQHSDAWGIAYAKAYRAMALEDGKIR